MSDAAVTGSWEEMMAEGLEALEVDDTTSAQSCFAKAVARAEAMGPDEPRLATSLKTLAGVLGYHKRYEEAERALDRLLDLTIRTLGPDHPDIVACLEHLAWIAERRGEADRALDLYRSALDAEDKAWGPGDSRSLPTLLSLARLYHEDTATEGASLGEEIVDRLEDVAETYRSQGRVQRAEQAEAYARHLRFETTH